MLSNVVFPVPVPPLMSSVFPLRICSARNSASGIEDFDLIEMVSLSLKELPPLFNGGFNDRVFIACKRNIRAVRFEEVLVDVKAGAEGFERGFQALYRVFLFRVVDRKSVV